MIAPFSLALAIYLSALAQMQTPAQAPQLSVIAHPGVPVTTLSRAEASAIFMRRTRSWPGGSEIVPVDQPPDSRIRARFSERVHGKSVAYVTRYWQRLIFSGRGVPPREEPDDEAVVALVEATPGAIGYVERLPPGAPVKVVEVAP
jgi:ABC-type phosphate transport system substrate-binding protein